MFPSLVLLRMFGVFVFGVFGWGLFLLMSHPWDDDRVSTVVSPAATDDQFHTHELALVDV